MAIRRGIGLQPQPADPRTAAVPHRSGELLAARLERRHRAAGPGLVRHGAGRVAVAPAQAARHLRRPGDRFAARALAVHSLLWPLHTKRHLHGRVAPVARGNRLPAPRTPSDPSTRRLGRRLGSRLQHQGVHIPARRHLRAVPVHRVRACAVELGPRAGPPLRRSAGRRPAHLARHALASDVGPVRWPHPGAPGNRPCQPRRALPPGRVGGDRPRRSRDRGSGRRRPLHRGVHRRRLRRPVGPHRHALGQATVAAAGRGVRRHLATAVHERVHELARVLHRIVGLRGLLDCPTRRHTRRPALVLLHRRPLHVRVPHHPARRHRRRVPLGEGRRVRPAHRGMGCSDVRHVLLRRRAHAVAARRRHSPVRRRRRARRGHADRVRAADTAEPCHAPRRHRRGALHAAPAAASHTERQPADRYLAVALCGGPTRDR